MKIQTLDVHGMMPAMHAMRNPMNSWDRSDTLIVFNKPDDFDGDEPVYKILEDSVIAVGENDKTLSLKLQKAGPEHCKHLRMVMCWVDIWAPRYWWQEFDTYRQGVEKVSCSTMHKLKEWKAFIDWAHTLPESWMIFDD